MFRDISIQMAGLVSTWCTTLLYGITLVVYFTCLYVLVKQRNKRSRSTTWILFCTATLQFILSTLYVSFGLRTLIEGFIWAVNSPGGTLAYWIDPTVPSQVICKALYLTNSIIGDCILVWRLYTVWGRNLYISALPILLVCGTIVTGYIALKTLTSITISSLDSLFLVAKWITATWALSIATQIICTALIAGKIWWHTRHVSGSRAKYLSVIGIIVESGAIYTISTILVMVFFDLKVQAGAIMGDIIAQIATIVPTLIIIQVKFTKREGSMIRNNVGSKNKISQGTSIALSTLQAKDDTIQVEVSTLTTKDAQNKWKQTVVNEEAMGWEPQK